MTFVCELVCIIHEGHFLMSAIYEPNWIIVLLICSLKSSDVLLIVSCGNSSVNLFSLCWVNILHTKHTVLLCNTLQTHLWPGPLLVISKVKRLAWFCSVSVQMGCRALRPNEGPRCALRGPLESGRVQSVAVVRAMWALDLSDSSFTSDWVVGAGAASLWHVDYNCSSCSGGHETRRLCHDRSK